MNCRNCGGPLEVVEGRDHLQCPFCEAVRFPEPLELSADRLVPLEEQAVIDCPDCEQPLWLARMDSCRVLHCRSCRGVLIPMADFADLVHQRRRSYKGPEGRPRPLSHEQLQRQIFCPACSRTMEVHPYYGPGSVVIDSCRTCRLVWLDSGEMARIEQAPGRR